jgi:predicted site-specific integrase-resolvase
LIKGRSKPDFQKQKHTGTLSKPSLVGATAAALLLGVERRTLFRWAKAGRLPYIKNGENGHWYFDRRAIDRPANIAGDSPTPSAVPSAEDEGVENEKRTDVIYARVSTRKQMQHLETQVVSLEAKHPDCVIIRDCGSGLNFRRKGLETLLQLVFAKRVRNVYLAYRDRLCRFAYDLLERIFREHGTAICVEAHDHGAPESVLAEDIIAIITVFGARLYGSRSGGARSRKAKPGSATSSECASARSSTKEKEKEQN